jgi:predicted ArsR family transcriptional regulator
MTTVTERFAEVDGKIAKALEAVEADGGRSPVLAAVVQEFHRKADKTRGAIGGGDAAEREAIVELEQAGDSAKYAAEADPGISDGTRQAVEDAHLAICVLKAKL